VPLDPIVSLSVALAEAPGTCACLLGAGVSVDAGVPTGWAVYREGLRRLYRLEAGTGETPDDESLDAWLAASGHGDLGYSTLLDLIAPDPATRRAFISGFFEGVEPGRTHELLASLAERGVIRVFVTTNFDRLLEQALLARGIDPVVVSDDATLDAAPRREHSGVFIVKAHGDYLQETMRNTGAELSELEPALTTELQTIVNHYGLLVIGWSGSDPAISAVLRARSSRYGVWWLSLTTPPAEPGRSLAEAIGARVINRDGASALLEDLDNRLGVYETYESGHDPGSVHDEMLGLIRRGDEVGLDEVLRRERYEFESAVDSVTADHVQHHGDEEHVRDAWGRLEAVTQRRLASLIPLALHRADLVEETLRAHAGWATSTPPVGGGATWQQAWTMPFWALGMTAGALLTRLDRYGALPAVLLTTWVDHYGDTHPLVDHPGGVGVLVAEFFGPEPPSGQRWLWPAWSWLAAVLPTWEWLTARYPGWLDREGEPQNALAEFDLLRCIAGGLRDGEPQLAVWTLNQPAANSYARRLHFDRQLRARAAEGVGIGLETFDARAPEIIAASDALGHFVRVGETANILRTGEPR